MNMPPQQYGAGPNANPQQQMYNPGPAHPAPQYGGAPGYGYGGAPPPPQYEFTQPQNEVIQGVASSAKGLGILQYISAALQLIGSNFIGAGVSFYVGYQFHQGGQALQRVVDTQGNDIGNLMEALDKIAGAFMIRLVLVAIAFGLFLIIGLAMSGVILAAITEASQQGM